MLTHLNISVVFLLLLQPAKGSGDKILSCLTLLFPTAACKDVDPPKPSEDEDPPLQGKQASTTQLSKPCHVTSGH